MKHEDNLPSTLVSQGKEIVTFLCNEIADTGNELKNYVTKNRDVDCRIKQYEEMDDTAFTQLFSATARMKAFDLIIKGPLKIEIVVITGKALVTSVQALYELSIVSNKFDREEFPEMVRIQARCFRVQMHLEKLEKAIEMSK